MVWRRSKIKLLRKKEIDLKGTSSGIITDFVEPVSQNVEPYKCKKRKAWESRMGNLFGFQVINCRWLRCSWFRQRIMNDSIDQLLPISWPECCHFFINRRAFYSSLNRSLDLEMQRAANLGMQENAKYVFRNGSRD